MLSACYVSYACKLNLFGFWTVTDKTNNLMTFLGLQEIVIAILESAD